MSTSSSRVVWFWDDGIDLPFCSRMVWVGLAVSDVRPGRPLCCRQAAARAGSGDWLEAAHPATGALGTCVAVHGSDLSEVGVAEHQAAVHAVVGERLPLAAVFGAVAAVAKPALALGAASVVFGLSLEVQADCGLA